MAVFVLVPGAWHGAWCFDELARMLRRSGHQVHTPDLPGMDGRELPKAPITLELWAEYIAQIVLECPEPPILLGHSRGGIVISEVAERIPDNIAETVYLAAALLPTGTVPFDGLLDRMPAGTKSEDLPDFLDPPPFADVRATAFSGCEAAVAEAAYARLVPEPVTPLMQSLHLTEQRFGSVPRTYIETLQDQAVNVEHQRAMQINLPCARSFSVQSDHSPFLSACADLALVLQEIADQPIRK